MAVTALRLKLRIPTEQEEQLSLFKRIDLLTAKYPALGFVFHVGNGAFLGANRQRYGQLLLNMGVRPGVPDIVVPIARGGFHGLWIELKRSKFSPSDVRPEQRDFQTFLREQGHKAEICGGWIAAWNTLANYLELEGEEIE